jgi:hypothetical protein
VLLVLGLGAIIVLHLGILAAAAMLVMRFRAARAVERQQLRWLGLAAIPFVIFVLGAFVASFLKQDLVLRVMAACFIGIIPLAAGISIEQHHLYDVDRIVSRAVSWLVLSAAVIGTYIVVVVFVGQSLGQAGDSEIPAVVATLAAASVVAPLRRRMQEALDRHFHRRTGDANCHR